MASVSESAASTSPVKQSPDMDTTKDATMDTTKDTTTKDATMDATDTTKDTTTKDATMDASDTTTDTTKDATETTTDTTKDAYNLLAQGKRNMLCGEVPNAVNQLQEACRLLAAKFGETADECGEAYFCYGKALLDLSRMESGVLGNALEGIEEDSDEKSSEDKSSDDKSSTEDRIEKDDITEEQKEKISDEVLDAMLETDEQLKKRQDTEVKADETEKPKENGTTEEEKMEEDTTTDAEKKEGETSQEEEVESEDIADEEGDTEEEEKEGDEKEGAEKDEEMKEGEETKEGEEGTSKKEEEDVSNLQLAWEMLELSKIIYKRHSQKDTKLKLAETHLKLGEVGLETETYETAISDFRECLKLQQELLEPQDRALAETYYQLGLACAFHGQYDDAIDSYRKATTAIDAKIVTLKKITKEGEEANKGKEVDTTVTAAQKELKDLEDILPDILAKIEDVLDEKRSSEKMKQMVKENVTGDLVQSTGFGTSDSGAGGDAKNISHLVRKKRKTDEDTDTTKKTKTEEVVNGKEVAAS